MANELKKLKTVSDETAASLVAKSLKIEQLKKINEEQSDKMNRLTSQSKNLI